MAQGPKTYSNQSGHGGWQVLEKNYRKTCGPFRLTGVKNPHTGVRNSPLCIPETEVPFLGEKGIRRGSLAEQVLPSLVEDMPRKRAPTAFFQSHPSPLGGR